MQSSYTQRPLLSNGMSNGFVRIGAFSWIIRRNATRAIRLRGSNVQKESRPAPRPPDQPGLPERDLENERLGGPHPQKSLNRTLSALLIVETAGRSQTALFSDRLGGHHGESVREETVDGCWVSVTLLSRD